MKDSVKKYIIAALTIVGIVSMRRKEASYNDVVDSTVWIQAGQGTGSGVFVLDGSYILTAYHVIEGENSILVYRPQRRDGTVINRPDDYHSGLKAVVVDTDPGKDLALLRVEGRGVPVSLATSSPNPGDPVFTIGGDEVLFGHNSGTVRHVYDGVIPVPKREVSSKFIEMTCPVNFGDSGGGVFNRKGELTGIVFSIDAGRNQAYTAIDLSEIRAFLGRRPWN